jgi:hypothetical protein
MPSSRDKAHDSVLCKKFSTRTSATAAGIAKSSQLSSPRPGQAVRSVIDCPSRTKSHPAGSLSSSQPSGPPCWASPLAFGLIGQASTPDTVKSREMGDGKTTDTKDIGPVGISYTGSLIRIQP